MKRLLLLSSILSIGFSAYSQQTVQSISDGNATNIFIWDCTCIPQPGDSVVVNHDVIMDTDWYSTGGLYVASGASLIEHAARASIAFDLGGSFTNMGSAQLTNVSFTNGAYGQNDGTFKLDSGLYVGPPSSFTNNGNINSLDSLMTLGTFMNGSNGVVGSGDIYVQGTFTNDGEVWSDSLLNEGTFTNTDYIYSVEFGNSQTFDNSGYMQIDLNFYNIGIFTSSTAGEVEVGADFWSVDSINGTALLTNDGLFEISGNWFNGDTLNGNGGYFCIGGGTSNWGHVGGTVDICDANAGGIDSQFGTVGAGVTFCATPCGVGISELPGNTLKVYPNPASTTFYMESDLELSRSILYDLTGRYILSVDGSMSSIDVTTVPSGTYVLVSEMADGARSEQVVVVE